MTTTSTGKRTLKFIEVGDMPVDDASLMNMIEATEADPVIVIDLKDSCVTEHGMDMARIDENERKKVDAVRRQQLVPLTTRPLPSIAIHYSQKEKECAPKSGNFTFMNDPAQPRGQAAPGSRGPIAQQFNQSPQQAMFAGSIQQPVPPPTFPQSSQRSGGSSSGFTPYQQQQFPGAQQMREQSFGQLLCLKNESLVMCRCRRSGPMIVDGCTNLLDHDGRLYIANGKIMVTDNSCPHCNIRYASADELLPYDGHLPDPSFPSQLYHHGHSHQDVFFLCETYQVTERGAVALLRRQVDQHGCDDPLQRVVCLLDELSQRSGICFLRELPDPTTFLDDDDGIQAWYTPHPEGQRSLDAFQGSMLGAAHQYETFQFSMNHGLQHSEHYYE